MNNKNKGNRILMLLIIGWGGGILRRNFCVYNVFIYII